MYKVQKITVIASFLGLWLTSYLSDKNQLVLGFILIFTFGILHGANDLVLISQLENRKKQSFFKILISYIAIVLISALLFTKIPICMCMCPLERSRKTAPQLAWLWRWP